MTQQALIDAAATVFADHGFERGSVRLITRLAKANQAAITYHFGGKEGLYRAVLKAAIAAFEEGSPIDEHTVDALAPADAVRIVIRQFLSPLGDADRLGRYMQIFGWEGISPTEVYTAFIAEDMPRLFVLVERLVRRFLPASATRQQAMLTAFWLVQQPIAFVHNAKRLRKPPFALALGPEHIETLVGFVTDLSLGGLLGHRQPVSGR